MTVSSSYGRGAVGQELGHKTRNAARVKIEAKPGGSRRGKYPLHFLPPSNVLPNPLIGQVQMAELDFLGNRVRT